MTHKICDSCETVAHCTQHGCVPIQPANSYTTVRNAWTSKATHTCNGCGRSDFRSEHSARFHTCEPAPVQPATFPEGYALHELPADYAGKLWIEGQVRYLHQFTAAQPANDHEFKNFHRLLCERFGYTHDEIDWKRDQISLIEWIAKQVKPAAPVQELDYEALFNQMCERCDILDKALVEYERVAQRPWTGLTDEQRRAIIAKLSEADYADGDEWDNALFDAIEAKLREKNQ